ncbi:MAG: sugar kinase [Spirochaetaceae bacterium]|jgi:xylulokinase|nr:sugar kinase [Spirochaetaceae bacterium]
MKRKIILAVDIGTSSLKAGFIDVSLYNKNHETFSKDSSRLLAFIREPYLEGILPDIAAGRFEKLPATEWENTLKRALFFLFRLCPDVNIEAICISGNGPTLIPVQKNEETLLPLYWFGKTTRPPGLSSFFLPHVIHFMETEPKQYEKTEYFCSSAEWLSFRLGAQCLTVLPTWEYQSYYWDKTQCSQAGVDIDKFPPFVTLGSLIGAVSAEAECLFGLKKGIPIVAGGPDFIMALLGTASVESGLVCDRAGSSEGINMCVTQEERDRVLALPSGDPAYPIRILPHVIAGLWNLGLLIPESGSLFDRWRYENAQDNKSYDELLAELKHDEYNGKNHALPGLSHSPRTIHPILLKIAGQVKKTLLVLKEAGLPVKEMRLSGGQAKNASWNKHKAKLIGSDLLVPDILDGELTGDAAAALLALGESSNLREACTMLVQIKTRFEG